MGLQLAFFVHIERSRLNIYWSEKCFYANFKRKSSRMGPVLFVPLSLTVCQIISREPNFQASIFNSGFSNTRIRPKARVVADSRSHVPYRCGYI
jgi:hypothetical protein